MKQSRILLLISVVSLMITTSFAQISLNTKEAKVYFNYESENTDGTLDNVHATIALNWKDVSGSSVSGSVETNTLSTGKKMRDKHLKSKDYFDVDNYPKMYFNSGKIEKEGELYFAVGTLKIKDIEKEVRFTILEQNGELNFETTIFAKDFDVAVRKDREKSKVHIRVSVPLEE